MKICTETKITWFTSKLQTKLQEEIAFTGKHGRNILLSEEFGIAKVHKPEGPYFHKLSVFPKM